MQRDLVLVRADVRSTLTCKVRLMKGGHCKILEYSNGPKLVDTFIEY